MAPQTLSQQVKNRNVWLTLVFTGTNSMALGLWTVILSNYLKLLTGSLAMVGYSETIQGVTKVLFSFVAGCFADKSKTDGTGHQRAMVLKISGMLSFVAMGVTIAALYIDRHHTYPDPHWTPAYWLMVIGLCLWGTFAGVYYPAMTAILADSVETGNRTSLYTYRWMLQMFTRAMGPLLGAVLVTYQFGDTWTLANLRSVFLAGMIGTSVPALLLFFFDDDQTLGGISEAVSPAGGSPPNGPSGTRRRGANEKEPLIDKNASINAAARSPRLQRAQLDSLAGARGDDGDAEDGNSQPTTNSCCCTIRWIPWCLAFSDLMFCIGQGMTVKFFSIYLQEIVLLTPSTVMIVSAVSTMVATFFSKIAERFTRCIGRVQTLILFRLGGVGTMVLLGLYSHDADHPDICHNATAPGHGHHNLMDSMDGLRYGQTVPGAPIFELGDQVSLGAIHEGTKIGSLTVWQLCVIALFVSQTGFFNSTQPIMKSILMDYVPKGTRGKWSAVDSLTSFGWSVTTVFGAMIVDSYCYSYLFYATAGCMLLSQLPFWFMLELVPRKERV